MAKGPTPGQALPAHDTRASQAKGVSRPGAPGRRRGIEVLDLDRLEADFWDRLPQQIHTDLGRPASFPTIGAQWRKTVGAAARALATISEPDRLLLNTVPLRAGFILTQWHRFGPKQRQAVLDWIITQNLRSAGPRFLVHARTQQHLAAMWQTIQHGKLAERIDAKKRWQVIFTEALPNFRGRRDPHDPTLLLREYEDAKTHVRAIPRQGSAEAYNRILRQTFPKGHRKDLADLSTALHHSDSDGRRGALLAIVATPRGLAGDTLREHLAEARSQQRSEARIRKGKACYVAWCESKRIAPRPA